MYPISDQNSKNSHLFFIYQNGSKSNSLWPRKELYSFLKRVTPYLEESMLHLPVCMKTQPTREENRIILFARGMAYVGESMSDEKSINI